MLACARRLLLLLPADRGLTPCRSLVACRFRGDRGLRGLAPCRSVVGRWSLLSLLAVWLLAVWLLAAAGWAAEPLPPSSPAGEDQPEISAAEEVEGLSPGELETLPPTTVLGEISGADIPVTTPTRTTTALGQSGSATTVITGEQIRNSQSSLVTEVLRGAAGLDVVEQGPRGGLTSAFLRGANSQHTKVLLDGIPINDPSSATRAFDFSTLSADNIERIEIVRGPQSTLYGTDAIGGVINIITRRGEGPPSGQASFLGGSYGTVRGNGFVSGGTELYHYSLGGSAIYSDGFSAASERFGNTEDDGYRLGSANTRLGWTPAENFDIDYVFRWSDVRADIDDASFFAGQPPIDDFTRRNLTRSMFSRVQARWDTLDGDIEHTLAFSLSDYRRRDTDDVFASGFDGQTRLLDYQANLALTENNLLTAGVDYMHETASNTFGTDAGQHKYGLYVQDQWQLLERWTNIVGFRWDDWNTAGRAETYQFRSVYRVEETGTAFHGTLGTGFRAPSLAENVPPFGNPALRPEESRGWDVGVTQQLFGDTAVVECYYFRNDFDDLILFDPNVPPFGALVNVGQARTHGVELIARWQLAAATTLNATYTRTDSLNLDTGLPLLRRPRDKGSVGVAQGVAGGRGLVHLYAVLVGERLDAADGSVVLDPYGVLNLAAHYQLTPAIRGFVRFDNLLDEQYEEVFGYATPGASAFGGLEVQW